jgi:DNA-binding PadR family transcriptional regulator
MERFQEPYQFLFLFMLKDGPVYGVKLAGRIEEASKGHLKVSYGTIYPFLRRMERTGMIRSTKDSSSRRIYYELTPRGRHILGGILKELDKRQAEIEEKTLGFLSIYQEVFGLRGLNRLLRRARQPHVL